MCFYRYINCMTAVYIGKMFNHTEQLMRCQLIRWKVIYSGSLNIVSVPWSYNTKWYMLRWFINIAFKVVVIYYVILSRHSPENNALKYIPWIHVTNWRKVEEYECNVIYTIYLHKVDFPEVFIYLLPV